MTRAILFAFVISLCAQIRAAAPPETVVAHFDKSFYVTGEVVWYKLYLPTSCAGKDFTVRLTVLNDAGAAVGERFLATTGKTSCDGQYALPFDLKAGVYWFWFTASRADGTTDELLRAAVPVYNDLTPLPADLELSAFPETPDKSTSSELNVRIEWPTGAPTQPRQASQLKITVTDKNGNPVNADGSVRVADDRLVGQKTIPGETIRNGNKLSATDWLPGIYQNGIVRKTDGQPLSQPLLPVLDVETHTLHFAESDKNGHFLLQLPGYEGTRRFQVIDHQQTEIKVVWQKPALSVPSQPLQYTAGVLEYLDLSRRRKKIYQLYGRTETELSMQTPEAKPLAWETKRKYQVQDYERFPDLATFFQEVIWMLKFTSRQGRFVAQMYNPVEQKDYTHPPLFLLDGKATFDADVVARLSPADVQTIELLNEPKTTRRHFPALGAGGVVRIQTISGDQTLPPETEEDIFALQGFAPPVAFPVLAPDTTAPLLRPLLLWQPDFATDKNGVGTVHFTQSDDLSDFCVEVCVQSGDGRRGWARFCYEVR